jgi:hypothetical protein
LDLQKHIDEHDLPINEHIKSIYAGSKVDGSGTLPEFYSLRLDGCKISKLTATKENVIHFKEGSVDEFEMTHGTVYFDGVKTKKIKATDSRIRISDTIDGKKSEIIDLDLTRCEVDIIKAEFRGQDMFKSLKDCRVNVVEPDVQCPRGGKADGGSINILKGKIFLQTKGWEYNNLTLQYSSAYIKMTGNIPLHEISSCYVIIHDTTIDSIKVEFVGSKYSVCASNSNFIGGCRAFEVGASGNIRMENCKCDSKICIKLKGAACSSMWHGGEGKATEIGIELEDGASAVLYDLTKLECGQIGISAKGRSWVYAENIQKIKGGQYACEATGFSAMELLNCKYEAPVAFKGEEGTFVVKGDSTQISAGITAQGSGTFVADDGDGTYF